MLRVLVLGSAAGGGFPQWNCNSAASRRSRAGDPAAPARTQSSIAVSGNGGDWVVLNASPDIRQQIAANPPLHPNGALRSSPISAVVLTNADVDHVAGLLTLRERHPFALYATPRVLSIIAANSIFRVLDPSVVLRRPLALDQPIALTGADGRPLDLEIAAFPVAGKVALYEEDQAKGPGFGTVEEDTIGLEVRHPGTSGRLVYIPGCRALDDRLKARLDGAVVLFFDGTLARDDEMIRQGTGTKTGLRMGHMSMYGPDGSIAALADLKIARRYFIHVNNTNPALLNDSPERADLEQAGWSLAYDGMEIAL